MSNRVFKYGLLPPSGNSEAVWDQLRKSYRAYNAYMEKEHEFREAKRLDLRPFLRPDLERALKEAEEAVQDAEKAVKDARIEARSKDVDSILDRRLKEARKAKAKAKEEKDAYDASVKDQLKEINDRHADIRNNYWKEVYKKVGLFSGSNLLVRAAVRAACDKTNLWKEGKNGKPLPKFKVWRHRGQIGIWHQRGIPVEAVFTDTPHAWVKIDPVSEDAWSKRDGKPSNRGEGKRTKQRTMFHLRLGKDTWVSFPIVLHRPFPKGAVIHQVNITYKKIGPRDQWSVDFIIDDSACFPEPEPQELAVALDLGWREIKESPVMVQVNAKKEVSAYPIRIGAWVGQDGDQGEFRIPPEIVAIMIELQDLKRIRKKNFNAARALLSNWMRLYPKLVPSWLLESSMSKEKRREARIESETPPGMPLPRHMLPTVLQAAAWIDQWEAEARLAALVIRWRHNRFDGDEAIFGRRSDKGADGKPIEDTGKGMEGWRYNDNHLWRWFSDDNAKVQRQKKELYRRCANILASKYKTLVLEDFNLDDVITGELGSEVEKNRSKKAHRNRQMAGPSLFRDALVWAFTKRGKRTVQYDAAFTSMTCSECGRLNFIKSNLLFFCDCGRLWDRDFNGASNLLKKWIESPDDAKVTTPARTDEKFKEFEAKKTENRRRMAENRKAKKVAKGTTRKDDHKAA